VVVAADQGIDLWVWDLARLTLTRLTRVYAEHRDLLGLDARRPTPALQLGAGGPRNLYAQAADGTGAAERLTTSANRQSASAVTPDGTRLLFTEVVPTTREDVMQVTVTGTHTVTPLVHTPPLERNGVVSPTAGGSPMRRTTRDHLRSMCGRIRMSQAAARRSRLVVATQPLWSHDGVKLFYVTPVYALMRVGVIPAASWDATTRRCC
jgi:hypothetical protein